MAYKVISFYKYIDLDIDLENPNNLYENIRNICKADSILGRILIGKEGINGAVSGTEENIVKFKKEIMSDPRFSDLTFREQYCERTAYHKLVVRLRNEIVVLGAHADIINKGKHISPEELNALYKNNEDFVILDARNEYEYKLGKFKDAVGLPIKSFREFPDVVSNLENIKNKKVVMYCTGGIRCEKSSAFLRENGFKEVFQLEGGIINYINHFPEGYWEGGLVVFDDRRVSKVGKAVTHCELCGSSSDDFINCNNMDCDRSFVSCINCQEKMHKTCSDTCKNAPRQRAKRKELIGIVENYYIQPKVALIKVHDKVEAKKIIFEGRTTKVFEQKIEKIEEHDNNLITIPVDKRVRKNDKVFVYL